MNNKLIGFSAACALIAGAGTSDLRADKVALTEVPAPVQRAIKEHSQGENLEHVERETRGGQTVYEAEFKREGVNRRVSFAADGKMLPGGSSINRDISEAMRRGPSMAVADLPSPVQKTIKEQQAGRQVEDIDQETWNGQTIYEVEFREKGPNSRLHIASDGSLVVDKERKVGTYLGTQLSEAPPAVQATVKRVVSSAVVEDVDRETRDGRVVYDVEVKQEGLNRHLKIAEDGTLVADTNNNRDRSLGERVREKVGLSTEPENDRLTLEQVPVAVQRTIRERANVGTLKPIKKETRDGRVQYDVEYEKEGKNLRMTVNEDGTILKDNR
jgi:uncharacterized membrane protein YkoI